MVYNQMFMELEDKARQRGIAEGIERGLKRGRQEERIYLVKEMLEKSVKTFEELKAAGLYV